MFARVCAFLEVMSSFLKKIQLLANVFFLGTQKILNIDTFNNGDRPIITNLNIVYSENNRDMMIKISI